MSVRLRQWCEADLAPFAALNRDPEVMRYFPAVLTRAESDAMVMRQRELIEHRGWGLWAVELEGVFVGFTGLAVPRFEAAFTPCVEIGWRFAREFWGRGIAFEAARQAVARGFSEVGLEEILSFTAKVNERSWRLMERLGFGRDLAGDFRHPTIPIGHELSLHVLYRKRAG